MENECEKIFARKLPTTRSQSKFPSLRRCSLRLLIVCASSALLGCAVDEGMAKEGSFPLPAFFRSVPSSDVSVFSRRLIFFAFVWRLCAVLVGPSYRRGGCSELNRSSTWKASHREKSVFKFWDANFMKFWPFIRYLLVRIFLLLFSPDVRFSRPFFVWN